MPREILTDATLATMERDTRPYGLIPEGAVAVNGGRIAWRGPADSIPDDYTSWARRSVDGRLITPALIDCHTHLVYGGDRAREFEMRLEGMSYEDIARVMECPVGTVRSRIFRAREAINARLDPLLD